jgi:hypothetical protein
LRNPGLANAADGTLTFSPGGTRVLNAVLDNQGTVIAQADVSIPSVTNSGWFEIDSGGRVRDGDTYFQTGGTTYLAGGTLAAATLVDVEGGVLEGNGTLDASVRNAGQIIVGLLGSPGVLTITGNFTQTSGGDLYLEVGGTRSGVNFGQLVVGGTANLGGTLSVVLINGYTPPSGTGYQVLTAGAVNGTFDTLDHDGTLFTPVYDPGDVTLVAL